MNAEEVADVLDEVRVSDISVDETGRVVIDNPEVAERLKAAATKQKQQETPININCVKGCGGTVNAVPGCGVAVPQPKPKPK
jgi:hypothetical protein